ncbi:hypothetical protein LOTGIDRAFT_229488 [Lottia gigantea]|uniref:Uncharacterized protein n=1 Tax=Lottia gigantea TaxID=225164 RepID=V3ZXI6_LOTGI|nr:hypothetical protein LOTGIDRAFT_229488 [Lottia gigantea]ESO85691.1 hypothetical protein LOTGIDRAFT_229488 [Lottia gigantea]
MRVLIISAVLVCMVALSKAWSVGMIGNFLYNPNDGYTCSYAECRQPGGGNRRFHVRCSRPNYQDYDCVYEGNPHRCAAYNNNGQSRYYAALASKSGHNRPSACSYWRLWANNMCTNIVMQKFTGPYGRMPARRFCSDY